MYQSNEGKVFRAGRSTLTIARLLGGWKAFLVVGVIILLLVFSAPFVFFTQQWTTQNNIGGAPTSKAQEEIPKDLIPKYIAAARRYNVPWHLLASIHKQETNFGRTTTPGDRSMISSAGAKGPMQFTDATWKDFGVDGDGDGKADVWNEDDAIMSAANMLRQTLDRNGGDLRKAVLRYNRSGTYADQVLARSEAYAQPQTSVSAPGMGKLMFPLPAPYEPVPTSNFGMRRHPITGEIKPHTGTDFGAAPGTPVMAAAGGTVTRAEWAGGYGNLVELDHNGFVTRYAHLSRIDVSRGQIVAPGQVVGAVGSTGDSTGPHLHFEVRVKGKPVDPMTVLSKEVPVVKKEQNQNQNILPFLGVGR